MSGGPQRDRARENPYPGTREFAASEKENFFGRQEEIDILAALVQARRTSLLFAQSGAGKSSLINAGLIPALTRQETIGRGRWRRTVQKMHVLPVASVGGGIPRRLDQLPGNVYAFSALYSLFPDSEPNELVERRLAAGIAPLMEEAGDRADMPVLLVFDQFEELFTHHMERWHERLPFFEQLAEALEEHPGLHVLLSMREDFIAELTPFAGLLPSGLRDRFRLERLRPQAALRAVEGPAERAGAPFAEGVAEELVDNLRRGQTGRHRDLRVPGGGSNDEPLLGEYVEPVHLQIVCRRLWDNLGDDRTSVEKGDLQQLGDVDEALRGFYQEGLRSVLERTSVPEHRLRAWFEDTPLITPARTRGLVYRGAAETEGLPNDVVDRWVDAYLIRSTQRGSDTWYELAHDRLVEPILTDNREWRTLHLEPLTVAAEAWEEADRDPRKLYSGFLLEEARAGMEGQPGDFSELELEFVAASLEAERASTRRRRRQLGIVCGVAVLLAVAAAVSNKERKRAEMAEKVAVSQKLQANEERKRAETAENIAISRELAARSIGQLEEDPEHSLLLALEALGRTETYEASAVLRRALLEPQVLQEWAIPERIEDRSASLQRVLNQFSDESSTRQISSDGCSVKEVQGSFPYKSAALSPVGHLVAAGDVFGVVRIAKARRQCAQDLFYAKSQVSRKSHQWKIQDNGIIAHREQINSIAFSRDGELLLTASDDHTAAVWAARSGRLLARLRGHSERVISAVFSLDKDEVLTRSPRTIRRWRLGLPNYLHHEVANLNKLEFSHDGRRLVTVSNDKAQIWDVEDGRQIGSFDALGNLVNDAAFSPLGNWVATAGGDGIVRVENYEEELEAYRLRGHDAETREILFSDDGERLLSRGADPAVRFWDWQAQTEPLQFRHGGRVTGAALSSRGDSVVTAGRDGIVKIWSLVDDEVVELPHLEKVNGASFDPAGQRVVTACKDGRARIWRTNGELLAERAFDKQVLVEASFSPDGHAVAVWTEDFAAYLWRLADDTLVDLEVSLGSPSFSSDDGRLVLTFDQTRARAWDAHSPEGRLLVELPLDQGGASSRARVNTVSWSNDGLQLAIAWSDGRVELRACDVCQPLAEVLELARKRGEERQPVRVLKEEESTRYLP